MRKHFPTTKQVTISFYGWLFPSILLAQTTLAPQLTTQTLATPSEMLVLMLPPAESKLPSEGQADRFVTDPTFLYFPAMLGESLLRTTETDQKRDRPLLPQPATPATLAMANTQTQPLTPPVAKSEPSLKTKPSPAPVTKAEEQTEVSKESGIKWLPRITEFLQQFTQPSPVNPVQNPDKLTQLQQEKDRLSLENELQAEKNRQTLAQLTAEKDKLVLENELQAARQTKLLAELQALKTRLELENTLAEQKQKKLLTELGNEQSILATQNALLEEKNKHQIFEIQMATIKLEFEKNQLELEKIKKGNELEELALKVEARSQKELWEDQVNKPMEYPTEPYQEGHLIISDRRIDIDWIILPGVGKQISERINYFNNKSTEYPIFLIIDYCVGGDVLEGAQILSAMQHSQAPVYVVVKTLSGSMCAVITTLAKHSYAYPNAIIVHHQLAGRMIGNKKQWEEQLEEANKWTTRILQPVADKMGLSMEEFEKQMYEHNSKGDWSEFADQAIKLKWIDTVVEDIRDTSYIKPPENNKEEEKGELEIPLARLSEKVDAQGQRYVELPALRPKDFYFLYNPDNYYR
jgi:ATP-dependent Clp protease protease subunit